MPTIDAVLTRSAAAHPHRVAMKDGHTGMHLTYAQMQERVTCFAHWLRTNGLALNAVVGLYLPNSIDFVVGQLATSRAGGASAFINYRLAVSEAARQLRLCAATVIVTTAQKAAELRKTGQLPNAVYVIRDGELTQTHKMSQVTSFHSGEFAPLPNRSDCDAIIRFTSGSTGAPKSVIVTHRAWLMRTVATVAESMSTRKFSSTLVLAPLTHSGGNQVLPAFMRFGTIGVLEDFDVPKITALLRSGEIENIQMAPTILHILLEDTQAREALRTSGIKRLTYGGSPIRKVVLDQALELLPDCDFVQSYGTHETGLISFLDGPSHRNVDTRYSTGQSYLVGELRVREIGSGSNIGEIEVNTPWLPNARLTEAGREELQGGWTSTGDLGEIRNGYVYLVDRMDDVIISGGFNIYPLEIEAVLESHPDVQNAVITSAPDEKWGERVVAFVVSRDGMPLAPESLRAHCVQRLAKYKVPKEFHHISEVPLNANGKPDRRKLREPMWAGQMRLIN